MTTTSASPPLWMRALAELTGTGMVVAIVVGSGIAAERLSSDPGLRLLENSLATALGLAVVILVFQPVSGSHLNPVVSLAGAVLDRGPWRQVPVYVIAQVAGAIGGSLLANLMFGEPQVLSTSDRVDFGRLVAEVVATAGLMLVVFGLLRTGRSAFIAPAVGAYIGAAYWFTSSTAFANPAVTVGRIFTDTFAGISPQSSVAFVAAQLVGGAIGLLAVQLLFRPRD